MLMPARRNSPIEKGTNRSMTGTSEDPGATYSPDARTYTRMGLVALFFWLLWGDFCFVLMEKVEPTLLPLALKDAGVPNVWIGIIIGTIPSIMSIFINPIVSYKSDRYRSKWGRRIPFLVFATPFVTMFLILIGFSLPIARFLHNRLAHQFDSFGLSGVSVILVVVTLFVIGFQFFNIVVSSTYSYLFADVVPKHVMGRFVSLFRVAGAGASFTWSYWIFGLASTHMTAIYVWLGILYFVVFMLMSWRVKEGTYPPPAVESRGPGVLGMFRTYLNECFRSHYYLWFFAGMALFTIAGCGGPFWVFFYRDTLRLSLDEIGKVLAWCNAAQVVWAIPCGYLVDRIHPVRGYLVGALGLVATVALCFFLIQDRQTMLVFTLLQMTAGTFFSIALTAIGPVLLPRERYGQFSAANGIVGSLARVLGAGAAGMFMDWVGNYRYVLVWYGGFVAASLFPMVMVYIGWQRHGGARNYVPPG